MLFGRKWGCCNQCRPACGNCNNCNNCECDKEVVEPAINKCVEKEFYHEVPHVCPVHTHVVNKHIYKHTYTPQFTCSEENQVVNMDCGNCGQY